MPSPRRYDAIVIGAGPNGLAAAITLAEAGRSVLLVEAMSTVGGGLRSAELTLPGFIHDICSAIHPLGVSSPFFKRLALHSFGLEWVYPEVPFGHPLDDGPAVLVRRSVDETAAQLGEDEAAYRRLMAPLARNASALTGDLLGPLRMPGQPLPLARFGLKGLRSGQGLARGEFKGERARAVFAGMAAHAILALEQPITAAFGLVMGMLAHASGWPLARGGSQMIANALAAYFESLGGEIVCDAPVQTIAQLPPAKAVLFDVTPRQLLEIAGARLPDGYRRSLERYRYGPGVFKMDFALSQPVPWKDPNLLRCGTVHIGGTLDEIALSERQVGQGKTPEKPYVLVAQQSLFDSSRAPAGAHTLWAYCHVPNGSPVDMTASIEAQIERFAPGFGETILAKHVYAPAQMQAHNPNYVGGDINGGMQDIRQLFARPAPRLNPYVLPALGLYLCSSSTPPGGGVHGMCGWFAARAALRRDLK
jgi:phytoene dehydrogenase-like protein